MSVALSQAARGCRSRIRIVLSDPDKVLAKDRMAA
jgi:hypothetical protein